MATKPTKAKVSKKPTKTTSHKSTARSISTAEAIARATSSHSSRVVPSEPIKIKKSYVVAAAIVALLIALAIANRGLFVAAMVNGRPVSRLDVVRDAEKQAGKQALDNLVRNSLIDQEAAKKNISVTDKEIDDEIKKIEETLKKQNQKIDEVLELQGMDREDLKKLIRLDKLVGKLVGQDVKVSNEEIDDYIEKNQETLPTDQTEEQVRKSVEESLKQQKLSENVQLWLAKLQESAKVQYFVQY